MQMEKTHTELFSASPRVRMYRLPSTYFKARNYELPFLDSWSLIPCKDVTASLQRTYTKQNSLHLGGAWPTKEVYGVTMAGRTRVHNVLGSCSRDPSPHKFLGETIGTSRTARTSHEPISCPPLLH